MNRFPVIALLTLLLFCPLFIKAQAEKCQIVDKSLPSQYLKYLDKQENDLVYQFVNNSTCSIVVEIEDKPIRRKVHKQNGTLTIEESSPRSGDEVSLHYYFFDHKKISSFESIVFIDTVNAVRLSKSELVYFRVNAKEKKTRQIAVKFLYEWEYKGFPFGGIGGDAPDNFVYSKN